MLVANICLSSRVNLQTLFHHSWSVTHSNLSPSQPLNIPPPSSLSNVESHLHSFSFSCQASPTISQLRLCMASRTITPLLILQLDSQATPLHSLCIAQDQTPLICHVCHPCPSAKAKGLFSDCSEILSFAQDQAVPCTTLTDFNLKPLMAWAVSCDLPGQHSWCYVEAWFLVTRRIPGVSIK